MSKFLKNLYLKNFRSISESGVNLELEDLTVLIGRNNSGKTNILRFIKILETIDFNTQSIVPGAITSDDIYRYDASRLIEFSAEIYIPEYQRARRQIAGSDYYKVHAQINDDFISFTLIEDSLTELEESVARHVMGEYVHMSGGDIDLVKKTIRKYIVDNEPLSVAPITTIHTENRVTLEGPTKEYIYDLTNEPTAAKRRDARRRLKELFSPVSDLFGMAVDAVYPARDSEPFLIFDNKEDEPIPFSSLASGIQSLINMAHKLISNDDKIILIDEPEIHLHPALQRAFLNHANTYITKSQLIVATHSSMFLDQSAQKQVISLASNIEASHVAATYSELQNIVADLGYRPSDIIQANGVIWVEGPSDRIYINRWLALMDSSLKEGLQYTFQFYGGSLLGRLTTEYADEVVGVDRLAILSLNPNFFFLMDSDQAGEYTESDLVPRQQSIINELKAKGHEFCYWVTAGRTIENYLPNHITDIGQYDDPTQSITGLKGHKVDYAMKHASEIIEADLNYLDLHERMASLANCIRQWNGLE